MAETVSINDLERWDDGFPGTHEFSTLNDLERPVDELDVFFDAARRLVEQWQGNHFVGLYLHGTPGTGKTHAAVGLARELHDAGAEIHYRHAASHLTRKDITYWNDERTANVASHASVFPHLHSGRITRNPKSVLLLDEYTPEAHGATRAAVQAAAEYGGLVIVTSNHPDPFKFTESAPTIPSAEELITENMASSVAPTKYAAAEKARQAAQDEMTASFLSRVAAGFKFIQFTGEDRRIKNSFWA